MKTPRGHPLTLEYYKCTTGEYIGKVVEIPEIRVDKLNLLQLRLASVQK
jgi:hypothetical protein